MVVRLEVDMEVTIVEEEVEAMIRDRDRISVVVMGRAGMDVEEVDMVSKVATAMASRVEMAMVSRVAMVMASRVEMAMATEVDTRVVDMVVDVEEEGGTRMWNKEKDVRLKLYC
jgi:hypothetical protein